ncbi:hypothetical protein [Sphingobacterium spiritivorum]|uniref:hypothetical protein n=1 Tax=Sphingobacterium spiritivorum TaxID=258 RepID=UPI003DA54D2C
MKTIEITTGKATIVVVDMPEEAHKINVVEGCYANEYKDQIVYNVKEYTENQILNHIEQIDLPQGHWKILNQFSQLTEDQWQDIVDVSDEGFECWNYEENDWGYHGFDPESSGLSLLRANEVRLENLFGEEPALSDYIFEEHPELVGNPKEYDHDKFEYDHSYWAKAQSEVWKNPYIFIKVK